MGCFIDAARFRTMQLVAGGNPSAFSDEPAPAVAAVLWTVLSAALSLVASSIVFIIWFQTLGSYIF